MGIRGFLSVIQTRKIKFSSIQFCIGNLVLFDFIYFQLSYFLNCLLSFRDYSPICSYNSNDTFLSFYCPGRVSEEKSRRLPFPLSVHIIPYINYSVWMAEKKDPALSFQRQYKVLSLLFSLMPVPFPLTSYPESFFLFSS